MQLICENSIYSYQKQISAGFITLQGGHRVGIVGSCVIENNKVINIINLDSGSYDKENNIISWSNLNLPHHTTFQFNNGMLVYENNSFYGTVTMKIVANDKDNLFNE